MKKIFMFLTSLFFLFVLGGCGNSLDIPEIEGVYSDSNISAKGELLSKKDVIIKKIGKNKYSINYLQFDDSKGVGNTEIYQEFEIVEVKKDREKSPSIYKFGIVELGKGKGYFEKREKIYSDSVQINELKFYTKTGAKKDTLSANIYLSSKSNSFNSYRTGFYVPKE